MVLGLLTAIAACPAIIGTTEAVRSGQNKNAKEKHRGQKTNLVATCVKSTSQSAQINGGMVVLKNHKVRNIHFCLRHKQFEGRKTLHTHSLTSALAFSSTSKHHRISTSLSKTTSNSKNLPLTPSLATTSHIRSTTGAGKAKGSSRPSALDLRNSIGYMWIKTPMR